MFQKIQGFLVFYLGTGTGCFLHGFRIIFGRRFMLELFFHGESWPSKLSKVVYGHFGQPKTSFSQLWCLLCKLGGGLKQVLFLLLPTWGNDPIWLIVQMGWNHQLVSHWNVHSTFVYLSLFESLYLWCFSSAIQVPNKKIFPCFFTFKQKNKYRTM